MRIATFATAAGLALLGSVALAKSVTYDYDRGADFSRYKTSAWTRGTELTDDLNHARIVRTVDAQLAAKGPDQGRPQRPSRGARRLSTRASKGSANLSNKIWQKIVILDTALRPEPAAE